MAKAALLMAVVWVSFLCPPAFSGQPAESVDKGAEMIKIYSGSMAPALFPHRFHQERLNDCGTCHALFPMKSGIIREMKDEGTLSRQQVMNTKCLACHKELNAAGKPAGPMACSQCHVRNP